MSSILAEGSSCVDGESSTSSNAELRSQLVKDQPLRSEFLRECNAIYSTDHGAPLASVMEAESADKLRGMETDSTNKREMQADSADKLRGIETDSAGKLRETEADSTDKQTEIEADSAAKQRRISSEESSGAVAPVRQKTSKRRPTPLAKPKQLITYICNMCGKDFPGLPSSVNHVRRAHTQFYHSDIIYEKLLTFKCLFCSARYLVRTDCVAHLINFHSASQCKYCWKLFKDEEMQRVCEKRHITLKTPLLACNKCDFRTVIQPSEVKSHIVGAHCKKIKKLTVNILNI